MHAAWLVIPFPFNLPLSWRLTLRGLLALSAWQRDRTALGLPVNRMPASRRPPVLSSACSARVREKVTSRNIQTWQEKAFSFPPFYKNKPSDTRWVVFWGQLQARTIFHSPTIQYLSENWCRWSEAEVMFASIMASVRWEWDDNKRTLSFLHLLLPLNFVFKLTVSHAHSQENEIQSEHALQPFRPLRRPCNCCNNHTLRIFVFLDFLLFYFLLLSGDV